MVEIGPAGSDLVRADCDSRRGPGELGARHPLDVIARDVPHCCYTAVRWGWAVVGKNSAREQV
jgi:hypothetical protein